MLLYDAVGHSKKAFVRSKKQGLTIIPSRGWQYRDGNNWREDDTLTVTENRELVKNGPVYPKKVTISSIGELFEAFPSFLGVYKMTDMTKSARPVWRKTDRDDRYLFYDGN